MEMVDIVGLCAFDEGRLRQTAATYGIPEDRLFVARTRHDYQQMLLTLQPDGVYAIGAPDVMFDIWVWCLAHRFNLFIEKPMGLTLHQSRMLAHLAEKNECITQVGHQRRSAPLLQQLKSACEVYGPISHASVEFFKADMVPMLSSRDRMLDDFTHVVDTARWLCGGEVIGVDAHCKQVGVPDINWIGGMLHFSTGATCFVIGNWASGRRVFRVQIHTPGACADIDPEESASLYIKDRAEALHFHTHTAAKSRALQVYGGFMNKTREFVNALHTRVDTTSSSFTETLKTMEVCHRILALHTVAQTSVDPLQ